MAATTLVELYRDAFQTHAKPDAFRHKIAGEYRDVSSVEARARIERIAAALHARGIAPGDRVAILAENRLEWALADFGILTAGAATVPIYATLTGPQARHILADSDAKLAIVSTPVQMEKVLSLLGELPALKGMVVMDLPAGAILENVWPWDDFVATGAAALEKDPGLADRLGRAVRPESLATLIYTSGTTGPPKGVMLTHANLASNVRDALLDFEIGPTDSSLSVLPLSHIFERMAGHFTMVARGVSIAYAENVDTLAANMLELRPTIVFAVPRLFEKIYARVLDRALSGSAVKRAIFLRARDVAWKWSRLTAARKPIPIGLALEHRLFDRLVYHTRRERVGGRLRFFVSGGAPLNPEIAEFFIGSGLPVLEGYGLTETSPVIAVNRPDRNKPGTVGLPIANTEVRIASDGEILVRSPGVMLGYYNRPGETELALKDGWFHTGDIGHLDSDGHLVITDRKKDLLVTAGGKNIAPQPIENTLKADKYIAEAVLIGDKRPYATALIVPNFDQLEGWARYKEIPFASRSELVQNPAVHDLYARRIAIAMPEVARYEQIKKFTLLDREFTIAAGELTPTLKVRRKIVNQKYSDVIDAMYGEDAEERQSAGGVRETG